MEALLLISLTAIVLSLALIVIVTLIRLRDSIFVEIPFVSTRKRALEPIIETLSLSKESLLYDLGCGNANLLKEAVKKVSGTNAVGIEKGYVPYILSCINVRHLPISIYRKDIFATNLSDATHIYCYLSDSMMRRLSKKFLAECKTGTRIVSCDFQMPDIPLIQTIPLGAGDDTLSRQLYVYEIS